MLENGKVVKASTLKFLRRGGAVPAAAAAPAPSIVHQPEVDLINFVALPNNNNVPLAASDDKAQDEATDGDKASRPDVNSPEFQAFVRDAWITFQSAKK